LTGEPQFTKLLTVTEWQ